MMIDGNIALEVLRELRSFRPGAPVSIHDLKAVNRHLASIDSRAIAGVLKTCAVKHPLQGRPNVTGHEYCYWTWYPAR